MKKNLKYLIRIFLIILILIYIIFFPISKQMSKIESLILLAFSILALIKARDNIPLFIMFMFIFYVNYSIVVGEYILFESLSVPMTQVKTELIYGKTLRSLLLFMSIVTLFYNGNPIIFDKGNLTPQKNGVVFYLILFVIMLVLVLGVNRTKTDFYSVKISPAFEYSKLLFLFAYFYSGDERNKKNILIVFMALFILTDFYYGGRITALQILILFSITIFSKRIKVKNIFGFAGFGIILTEAVGAFRSFNSINILAVISNMFSSALVFDTATYSYYASATHVAAYDVASYTVKIKSLFHFIKSIIFGSGGEIDNVTSLVSLNYFSNIGGGLIPTYFYFWLGWGGVILIASIIVLFINKFDPTKSYFNKMIYFAFIISSPRWYLYTPNQLFRGVLFFVPILYIGTRTIHILTTKRGKYNN